MQKEFSDLKARKKDGIDTMQRIMVKTSKFNIVFWCLVIN